MKLNVLGIIPARYGSSRFPGKPLLDLKGKTMIQRVYEGASLSSLITTVVVATDDQRIYDEVVRFGGKVIMTREEHISGTDRCGEVLEHFKDVDVVINIQGDEPLIDYRQLDTLIDVFEKEEIQIATLGIKTKSMEDILNPNRIKIVVDKNDKALYFSRSSIPNFNNFSKDPLEFYPFLRHIGVYAYRAKVLTALTHLSPTSLEKIESLEQLRWLYHGFPIHVAYTTIETPNIDSPDDVASVLNRL
ncbi:MAG: 3-deoxy-manno-octulosonate cytidylyltransferase [Crocinitomicaceae bacterium]|nr:3-deoxy-manno-octulosonate cytidylyltransferase [Crocinitomicaceae bacterium]